jgi:hypothetical protein
LKAHLLDVGRRSMASGEASPTNRVSLDPVLLQALIAMSEEAARVLERRGSRRRLPPGQLIGWLLADHLGVSKKRHAWIEKLSSELARPISRRK